MIKNKKHTKIYLLISLVISLIGLRAYLPIMIKDYLNQYLETKVESYTGHIEDFDLSLWRGAYQIEGFTLKKKTSTLTTPFIFIESADISISWKALFRGHFLVDLDVINAKLNFTDDTNNKNKQKGVELKEQTWSSLFDKLVPFNLESLEISGGEINLVNEKLRAPLKLTLNNIHVIAENIHNSKGQEGKLFSSYEIKALAQKDASFYSIGSFNILSQPLAFDINLKLEKLDLRELNNFLKAYVPLDITSGNLNLYMELASRDSNIKGYIKPMIEDMDVREGKEEVDNSFKEFGYEILTAFVNIILQNTKNKTLATKIPIEGSLKNPDIGIWDGVKLLIKNGFGEPKVDSKIDNEIKLKDVPKK